MTPIDYLKQKLAAISATKEMFATVNLRDDESERSQYPYKYGELSVIVQQAARDATAALRWTMDHIEPEFTQFRRAHDALEGIGVDLDEETLKALELLSKPEYRSERRQLADAFARAISAVKDSEAEVELQSAIDSLEAAGYKTEDGWGWTCESTMSSVDIETTKKIYVWIFKVAGHEVARGSTGDFPRLIDIINAPATSEASR